MDGSALYPVTIFVFSLGASLIPHMLKKIAGIRNKFVYISALAAGFLLGMLLLDFVPHTIGHGGHGHHKQGKREINHGLFTAGLTYIFLIGIDVFALKHSHCDEKTPKCDGGHSAGHVHGDQHSHSHSHATHAKRLPTKCDESIGTCGLKTLANSTSFKHAMILTLALSIHSFFEGCIPKMSHKYFIALTVHKIPESFALGANISHSSLKFSHIFLLSLIYSALTPIGMCIMLFNKKGLDSTYTNIFQGLALGSTLFIACFEMIPPMFHGTKSNLKHLACVSSGYVLSSLVVYYASDQHNSACCS